MSLIDIQQEGEIVCVVDQYGKLIAASDLKGRNINSLYCYHLKGWQGPCPECPVNIETKRFFSKDETLNTEDMIDVNLNKPGFIVRIDKAGKEQVLPLTLNIGNATLVERVSKLIQKTLISNQNMEKDFELGGRIQASMMTEQWDNPAVSLDLIYKPYNKVSGDIFDIQEDKDRGIFFMIGDVSGHGIGPSLISAYIKSFVYQHLSGSDSVNLSKFATYMNRELCKLIRSGDFITMFMGYMSIPDLKLEYLCMGHPQPFLYRSGELFEIVENIRHVPLLMVDDMQYTSSTFNLKQGDVLLLYTDGIIDMENRKKDKLGIAGLRDLFFRVAGDINDKESVSGRIYSEVRKFAGGDHYLDDMTLASIKITGNSSGSGISPGKKTEVNISELEDLFRRK